MANVNRLGNLYGDDRGTGFAGNVWDKDGLSPTITTAQGGMREPMIVEDYVMEGNFNQCGKVHSENGICRTIMGGGSHCGNEPKVLVKETNPIRMVRTEEGKALRKAYESGEIHHGFNEHRKAEIREDGICNTISTVEKDTLVCEKTIVASRGRNPDNPSDRTAGNPTEQRLEPNSEGICNCLTSVQKDNMVLESAVTTRGNDVSGTIRRSIYKNGARNIEKNCTDGGGYEGVIETRLHSKTVYRIRKLTPLECWRLMDFSDEDFRKAEKVNSNTQLYKQAGNSIVCAVLCAIFSQLGIEGVGKWNDSEGDKNGRSNDD